MLSYIPLYSIAAHGLNWILYNAWALLIPKNIIPWSIKASEPLGFIMQEVLSCQCFPRLISKVFFNGHGYKIEIIRFLFNGLHIALLFLQNLLYID